MLPWASDDSLERKAGRGEGVCSLGERFGNCPFYKCWGMCVCACVCACVCLHVYMFLCACVCACVRVCMYLYVCV